eukprot:6984773-Pyramimonas_sp.AAC.1
MSTWLRTTRRPKRRGWSSTGSRSDGGRADRTRAGKPVDLGGSEVVRKGALRQLPGGPPRRWAEQ